MANLDFSKIKKLDHFKKLAKDETLSKYEKVGFPDSYREGIEELIFADIISKVPLIEKENKTVLEIGPGCTDLPGYLIKKCRDKNHKLIFADCQEMLDLINDDGYSKKISGFFPDTKEQILEASQGGADVIICYSVLICAYEEMNYLHFVDALISLLKDGGQMIIGDNPNISKRKRFFASQNGINFHKKFMKTDEAPLVEFNKLEERSMDDAALHAVILRAQAAGCDAYILPQAEDLPFANRRDDIIIRKP